MSSGASGQTVQRPTVGLRSGFWRHWIHSIPKLYTATRNEIVVWLVGDLYSGTDNGDRIYFWNASTLESPAVRAGRRIFCCITVWMIWAGRSSWLNKNNVQLIYIYNVLPWMAAWIVFQMRKINIKLRLIYYSWTKGNVMTSNYLEIFPVRRHDYSHMLLLKCDSLK